MNRFGTREDVSVSGTVYVYSGPLKGKLGSIFGKPPRTSNGLMKTSFAPKRTDSGENASVDNYESTGVWKQRFVDFSRDEDGFSLTIYRAKPDPEAMARWASPDDVAQAGLPANESFPVGGSSPAYDASTSGSPKSPHQRPTSSTPRGRRSTFTQQMRSMSKVHNNTLADDPMKQHMFENQLFKQQIDKKEAGVRQQFRLTEKPITVRNVQLRSKFTEDEDAEYFPPTSQANSKKHQPVAFFILRKKSNFQAIHHVEEHQFVVQIEIEGGLLEIVGRTDEHTEKWYHRLQAVSRIHTAFCKLQRILLSRALNPVLPGRDEFPIARILQNPDTPSLTPSSPSFSVDDHGDDNEASANVMTQMLLCKMSLSYSRKGFDVTFVGRAVSGRTMTWRIALDEQPIANTVDQYTEVKGVLLTNVDLERISLAVNPEEERFLAGRPLETLRILRGGVASERTGQGTSSLYYLSKWVNFIAAFAKLYLASHPGDSDRWGGGQEGSGIFPSAEGIIGEASGADFSGSDHMSPTVRLMHDSARSPRSTAVGSPRSEVSLGGMEGMAMGGSLPMDSPRDLMEDGSPRSAPTSPTIGSATPNRGQQASNTHSRSGSGTSNLPPKRRTETVARNTTIGTSTPSQPPLTSGVSSSKQSSTPSSPRHTAAGFKSPTDLPLPGIHISNSAESSIHESDRLMGGDSGVFRATHAPTAHPSKTSSPNRAGGTGDQPHHNQKGGRSPSNPSVAPPPQAQVRPSGTRAAADAIANTTFGEFVSEGDQTDTTTSQTTSPAISQHGGGERVAAVHKTQFPPGYMKSYLPPVPRQSRQSPRGTSPRNNYHRSSGSSSPSHRHQSPRMAPSIQTSDSDEEDGNRSRSSSGPSGLASGFSINSSLESTPRRHHSPKLVPIELLAIPRGNEIVRKHPHISNVHSNPRQPLLFTPTVHVPHSELHSTVSQQQHLIDGDSPTTTHTKKPPEGRHKKKLRSRFLKDEQTLVESMVPFFGSGNHEAAMLSILSFRSAYPPVMDLIATPAAPQHTTSSAVLAQHQQQQHQSAGLPTPKYRSHTPNSRRDDTHSSFF